MSDNTAIEWCDASLAIVTGCSPAGVGCAHCYARRMWPRLRKMAAPKYGGREFSEVRFHPEELERPRSWKRPRAIFISPMGDLFHEAVADMDVARTLVMMEDNRRHTFIVLTKRIKRANELLRRFGVPMTDNMVLGVSCSKQSEADDLVHDLRGSPVTRIVVSLEPLVGPVRLDRLNDTGDLASDALRGVRIKPRTGKTIRLDLQTPPWRPLSGVIVGGETGPGARPLHPDWVRSLRDQCEAAGVPFFFKQWGEWRECVIDDTVKRATTVDGARLSRVGRSRAGRLLDGRTHDELCWDVRGKGEA